MRWNILIEPLGYKPTTLNSFYAVMIGYFANLAAPRLGEITRCVVLNKSDKIPFDSLVGTVIVERIIDLITLVILIIIIFFSKINFFGLFLIKNVFNPLSAKLSNFFPSAGWAWLLFLIGLGILTIFWLFRKKLSRITLFHKLKNIIKGVIQGLKSVYTMRNFWAFLGHSLFIWTMYFLMTWVLVFSLPETSGLKPIDGLFLLVIGSLGMAAPVQGGIGAYHWIVSLGLTIYGIPKEKGLAFATISHESQILLLIIIGAISMFLFIIKTKKTYISENIN